MTSLTPAGGFCMVFTMVMSFCFSVSRAARAASMAGIATASLASQSSCLTQKSSGTVSEVSLGIYCSPADKLNNHMSRRV